VVERALASEHGQNEVADVDVLWAGACLFGGTSLSDTVLSTSKVEVVEVSGLRRHPNADTLSIVDIFNGFPCVVRTSDWVGVARGAYIPPDSIIDVTRPEFSFLAKGTKTKHRIKAVKLRKVVSFGLLMPAPPGSSVGDDVAAFYGVEHYEPQMASCCSGGEAERPPVVLSGLSKFDVDSLRRYRSLFADGEPVCVTEKIHGANARFSFFDDRMWCGSRAEWKAFSENNLWWKALKNTTALKQFCWDNPGWVAYGEVYGDVQLFRYGCLKGEVRFAAFDMLNQDRNWVNAENTRRRYETWGVPQVPLLGIVPYDFDAICAMAEGPSQLTSDHCREGCVVKPLVERRDDHIGRVCLKVVGAGYLEKD
jgi:RNA ligase (TIGR02306 family)